MNVKCEIVQKSKKLTGLGKNGKKNLYIIFLHQQKNSVTNAYLLKQENPKLLLKTY